MRLTIYTERRAEHVPTGALVDTGDQGVILVDEKREKAEGSSRTVSLLGQRVGSAASRRVHVRYVPHAMVRIVPDKDQAAAAWAEVLTAVEQGRRRWAEENETGDANPVPPWEADHGNGSAVVKVQGTRFTVRAEHEPEDPGRRLPDDSDDDGGEAPADA